MRVHRITPAPQALIFDIDNTLYENPAYSEAQIRLQVERLAAVRGESFQETEAALAKARAEYAAASGGAQTSLGNAFELLGVGIETSITWREELLKPQDFLRPDPRLIQCLRELSRGFRIAALTNNPISVGMKTLECLGVAHFFTRIVGLDSCRQSKPSLAPFLEILGLLELPPSACLSIGDRFDVDIKVPLELGMGGIEVEGMDDIYALPGILLSPSESGPGRESTEGVGAGASSKSGSVPESANHLESDNTSESADNLESGKHPKANSESEPAPEGQADPAAEKKPLRGPSRRWLLACGLLPLILGGIFLASSALKKGAQAYSLPLIDKAEGRLDAKTVCRAYMAAYPQIVTEMKRHPESGDWMLRLGEAWFFYANGRFLPEAKKADWQTYRPYMDAIYPWRLIEPSILPQGIIDRLRSIPELQKTAVPSEGSFAFALYQGSTEGQIYAQQVRRKFLGWDLTVHQICEPALGRVEAEILELAKADPKITLFIKEIGSLGGYNWRYIRGQQELSRHSFGIAVDILPKNYGKVSTYWQWDMEAGIDWVMQKPEKRWNPPEAVVDAFEKQGFIWGGKWLTYDTMHFEYRPEQIRLREKMLPRFLSLLE